MKSSIIGMAIIAFTIFSCQKDDINPGETGQLSLQFDNRIGSSELKLAGTPVMNQAGESYIITTLNFFISNIKLTDQMGNTHQITDQYYLVKESDASSQEITLKGIPAGDYRNLSFSIGVDSLKSVSDVSTRTGVLDPASYGNDNMYWSWNMGYIFFKMEGTSPAVSSAGNKFEFHIGGFGGKDAPTPNNLREVSLQMNEAAEIRAKNHPEAHIIFDISKVFEGLKIADNPMIHNPKLGIPVSNNYSKGFILDHIHQ